MTFYIFIGTTAELIKILPIIKEIKKRKINYKLITSGQGKILISEFVYYQKENQIDYAFDYKGDKSSPFRFMIWAIRTLFYAIYSLRHELSSKDSKNNYFIVHGDTISSLIGTLLALFYGLKLIHVESGLRSYNFFEPFPEELSRYIISHIAYIHFCPNSWCINNLKNVGGIKINTYQNTLLDIFRTTIKKKNNQHYSLNIHHKYFVLVIHRQEHVFFQKEQTRKLLKLILQHGSNYTCVLIMHQLTSDFFNSFGPGLTQDIMRNIKPLPRLPYNKFMTLVQGAEYFITDGGSNQEEAYYFGIPCLLLRKHTERIEGLGKNVVLSEMSEDKIVNFMTNYNRYRYKLFLPNVSPSRIIVDYLASL